MSEVLIRDVSGDRFNVRFQYSLSRQRAPGGEDPAHNITDAVGLFRAGILVPAVLHRNIAQAAPAHRAVHQDGLVLKTGTGKEAIFIEKLGCETTDVGVEALSLIEEQALSLSAVYMSQGRREVGTQARFFAPNHCRRISSRSFKDLLRLSKVPSRLAYRVRA